MTITDRIALIATAIQDLQAQLRLLEALQAAVRKHKERG